MAVSMKKCLKIVLRCFVNRAADFVVLECASFGQLEHHGDRTCEV